MDMAGSIEMWLNFDALDKVWRLVNARLLYRHHAQRMLFDAAEPLDVALAPDVAECLEEYLSVRETAVFSNRDLVIDLGDLRVVGLRVLIRFDGDGNATANIRLMSTDGDMSAVFAPEFRPGFQPPRPEPASSPTTIEDVTMPVLQELLYPALEIFDHILENGLSEENAKVLAARVKTMRAKRDELSDYVALLTRFIEASDAHRSTSISGSEKARPLHLSTRHPLSVRSKSWNPRTGFQSGENALILHGDDTPSTLKH